jgi:integrase
MAGALTPTAINKAVREARTAGQLALRDPGHRGLWLRVGKSGSKTWTLRARDTAGKPHWFALGQHPEMGLSDARKEAAAMLVAVRAGANPIAAERRRRAAASASAPTDTLAAVLDLYTTQRGTELKSWAKSQRTLKTVFAPLLPSSLRELAASDFQIVADQYRSRQTAAFAARVLRPVLKWAAKPGRGYCTRTLAEFDPPAQVKVRSRVLRREELARLLPVLASDTRFAMHAACCRFLLLTATRLTEATGARWDEIDPVSRIWTIPAERTKGGRPHVVPLSRQAVALLEACKEANAASVLPPDGLVFASAAGTELAGWYRVGQWHQGQSQTENWHRHDLRRTSATIMGELGTDPHVIEAALGHADLIPSKVAGIYNRARYIPQVAAALQQLADFYDTIRFGEAEKIVVFGRPA